MSNVDFDSVVKSAAEKITEADVRIAKEDVETKIEGRAWNMNQRLNMSAYEDQK